MDAKEDVTKMLIQLVKQEVKPAVGCTEPVAVAFAAATARKYLKAAVERIGLKVSLSIYKNGKSVMIPGTEESGLDLAAALGAILDYPREALRVFESVNPQAVSQAKRILTGGMVSVVPVHSEKEIYIEVDMKGGKERVRVVLTDNHTHIRQIEVNDEIIFTEEPLAAALLPQNILKTLTFKDLREAAEAADMDKIAFLLEGVKMNRFAAEQGLAKKRGLALGAGLLRLQSEGKMALEPSLRARILTAAGADFRMGGGSFPVMTSGGSGNQGLGIILPISVVAEQVEASPEKLARALFFGHLINLFVKTHTGKLSALCGCAIAAGIGASGAIAWLLGGDDKQVAGAVKNMLANLTGMICDGAKESCAMKLSTSAGEAVIAAYLACENVIVPDGSGIVNNSVEGTIRNVGLLCEKGLEKTDEVLVGIISDKTECI